MTSICHSFYKKNLFFSVVKRMLALGFQNGLIMHKKMVVCGVPVIKAIGKRTFPDQTRPDQTKPDQTRPDQTRPKFVYAQPDEYSINDILSP